MPRKYQQRGYQDDYRERPESAPDRRPKGDGRPRRGYGPREPRMINMPAFRDVHKCARCGASLASSAIRFDSQCAKCAADLHSCAQCTWFDTSRTLECAQSIPKRVTPKDARNSCTFFEARVTVERETHSSTAPATAPATPGSSSADAVSARQAFDDLFK